MSRYGFIGTTIALLTGKEAGCAVRPEPTRPALFRCDCRQNGMCWHFSNSRGPQSLSHTFSPSLSHTLFLSLRLSLYLSLCGVSLCVYMYCVCPLTFWLCSARFLSISLPLYIGLSWSGLSPFCARSLVALFPLPLPLHPSLCGLSTLASPPSFFLSSPPCSSPLPASQTHPFPFLFILHDCRGLVAPKAETGRFTAHERWHNDRRIAENTARCKNLNTTRISIRIAKDSARRRTAAAAASTVRANAMYYAASGTRVVTLLHGVRTLLCTLRIYSYSAFLLLLCHSLVGSFGILDSACLL